MERSFMRTEGSILSRNSACGRASGGDVVTAGGDKEVRRKGERWVGG